MRKLLLGIFITITALFCKAQNVGIGTNTPASSAQLDITSTNKGLLLPRLTTALRQGIANPAKGLLVYDSTLKQFHYYDGSGWQFLQSGNLNSSGWLTSTGLHNDNSFVTTSPDLANRIVTINSPIMSNGGWNGNYKSGGLSIYNPSIPGEYVSFLTMDGRSIQARRRELPPTNIYYDEMEDNLILNRYGGNVGIFNNAPVQAKLMVNGTVGASVAMFGSDKYGITISADNPEIGFNYYYNNGSRTMKAGRAAYIGMSPDNGRIYIGNFNGSVSTSNFGPITGATTRMTLLQNGNVGIGTDNPTYKLSVNGNIRSKEVVVESGWADYVFDDNYTLRSLDETERFIKENKHLPGIPSAKEIQENGLKLGDVQTKMMAKIEELTLYVIELKKEIELLKNR